MNAKVRDVMTTPVVAVRPATSFKELAALLRKYRVSGFPVLGDDQKVIGVVSEADLLAKEALSADHAGTITAIMRHKDLEKADGVTAGDLMTRNVVTVRPDDTVEHAARLRKFSRCHREPRDERNFILLTIVHHVIPFAVRETVTILHRDDWHNLARPLNVFAGDVR